MKTYLAGNTGFGSAKRERQVSKILEHRLHSFCRFIEGDTDVKECLKMKKRKVNKPINLFIDSGAFSAFTQNIVIDIQEYIKFIKKNIDYIDVYANLDVIGDAAATWENQKIMEKAGQSPIPCFHYGEDIYWLKKYLKDEYKYIALGGMVPISVKNLFPWLNNLFTNYICDEKGMPKAKIHGFGMTSLKLMLRYPWYSVDSTSWVTTSRMGGILIPRMEKGKYIYHKNPWKIAVSAKSPTTKQKDQHISNLSSSIKKQFIQYFKKNGYVIGKSEFRMEEAKTYIPKEGERWNKKKESIVEKVIEPGICNDYKLRDELNIIYFLNLEKSFPEWPWPMSLLNKTSQLF